MALLGLTEITTNWGTSILRSLGFYLNSHPPSLRQVVNCSKGKEMVHRRAPSSACAGLLPLRRPGAVLNVGDGDGGGGPGEKKERLHSCPGSFPSEFCHSVYLFLSFYLLKKAILKEVCNTY